MLFLDWHRVDLQNSRDIDEAEVCLAGFWKILHLDEIINPVKYAICLDNQRIDALEGIAWLYERKMYHVTNKLEERNKVFELWTKTAALGGKFQADGVA